MLEKTIKFSFLAFLLIFLSCSKNEIDTIEMLQKDIDIATTRAASTLRKPMYRWYIYSPSNSDHYFNLTPGTSGATRVFDNRTFAYDHQEFCILSKNVSGSVPLYTKYDSTNKDHLLQLNNGDSMIGYIYTQYTPGTIPLLVYYSQTHKNHLYVVRNSEVQHLKDNEKSYSYKGILGWVYPGRADSKKSNEYFHFKNSPYYHNNDPFTLTITFEILLNGKITEEKRVLNFTGMYGQELTCQVPRTSEGGLLISANSVINISNFGREYKMTIGDIVEGRSGGPHGKMTFTGGVLLGPQSPGSFYGTTFTFDFSKNKSNYNSYFEINNELMMALGNQ